MNRNIHLTTSTTAPTKAPAGTDYELIAVHAFRIAFLMTENRQTPQAKKFINESIPKESYEFANAVNESNRQDVVAFLFRYVFMVIAVHSRFSSNTNKNYLHDLKKMYGKVKNADWDEITKLYGLYRAKGKNRCPCEPLPLFPCP